MLDKRKIIMIIFIMLSFPAVAIPAWWLLDKDQALLLILGIILVGMLLEVIANRSKRNKLGERNEK